ncbi:MAG: LuxR C-terminal-related transcriptional regulator [Rhodocyclaceae bacterium]|nr:LuxR C-terminal-related transcriptional regulator [Rhodocyclaceae bacterium]
MKSKPKVVQFFPSRHLQAEPRRARSRLDPPHFGFEAIETPASKRYRNPLALPKILLAVAPAGYGKTVFLAELHRASLKRHVRTWWFSPEDSSSRAETALGRLEDALRTNNGSVRSRIESRIEAIVEALDALPGETLLIFDYVDPATDTTLAPLLDHLVFRSGANVRIAVGSNALPAFSASRARMEGLMKEVSVDELKFSATQIRSLFAMPDDTAYALSETDLQSILRTTEGWPAAVRLLRIAATEKGDLANALTTFDGTDRDLAALFADRVLAFLDPTDTEFIHRLAAFRSFCPELCQYALGDTQTAARLASLTRHNALIFPAENGWFRIHPLLRKYLAAEACQRVAAKEWQAILVRAAEWCHRAGRWHDAIDYAVSAGDGNTAGAVLAAAAQTLVRDLGQHTTFIEWYEQALAIAAPIKDETRLWYMWALMFARRYEKAFAILKSASAELAQTAPEQIPSAAHLHLQALRTSILCALDRVDEARAYGAALQAHEDSIDPFANASVACAFTMTAIADLDFPTARRSVMRARTAMLRTGSEYGLAWVACLEALIDVEQGEFVLARSVVMDALERARYALGANANIVSTLEILEAKVALELGETDRAAHLVRTGLDQVETHGFVETTKIGLEVATRLWDGALDSPFAPKKLALLAAGFPPRLQLLFSCDVLVRMVQLGKFEAAIEWSKRFDMEAKLSSRRAEAGIPDLLSLDHSTVSARLAMLIAQRNFGPAMSLAETELTLALKASCAPWQVRLHLVKAQILMMSGHSNHASRAISRAINVAARRSLRHPFAEYAEVIRSIVATVPRKSWIFVTAEEIGLFEDIKRNIGAPPEALPYTAAEPTVECDCVDTPTCRELEFLQLLEAGLSNQEIADRLNLTIATVKWHLHNLYAKLAVKTRSAALAKAKRLQLLAR